MRVGVLGGTFNPIHLGHLIVAADAHRALSLDRVLFVPSAEPPHKPGGVSVPAASRLKMVRAAVRGDPRFAVDDLELHRRGPSYTVDTLRVLRERWPDADICLLIGADLASDLDTWRHPEEIAREARIIVLTRNGQGMPKSTPVPAEPLQVTRVDISATEIRRRAERGETLRYLVPEPVRAIIERGRLYHGVT